ncbi:hypothetical protein A2U01_0005651 [Trifolium medium]|uniref:Uncharacterized protein n=1 Tax=Trifolium medium TaxID=97028 RepID=A0A392MEY3_9FABA|nr:hypothetical protein [Trifolium medium]
MWMISRLLLRDPIVVSEPMVRRRIQPTLYIESLPDKGSQVASPVEHSDGGTNVWMKEASA